MRFVDSNNLETASARSAFDGARESFSAWYSRSARVSRTSTDDPLLRMYVERSLDPASRDWAAAGAVVLVAATVLGPFARSAPLCAAVVFLAATAAVVMGGALTHHLRRAAVRAFVSALFVWATWTLIHVATFGWAIAHLSRTVPVAATMVVGALVGAVAARR